MAHSAPYWQLLVVKVFRLGVRLAVQQQHPTLGTLKDLFSVAVFQELSSYGYTNNQMSILLGCAPGTIRRYSTLSREMGTLTIGGSSLHRIIASLEKGPCTLSQLEHQLPESSEMDVGREIVRLLVEAKLARHCTIKGEPGLSLIKPLATNPEMARPAEALELLFQNSIAILLCLSEGHATVASLKRSPSLRGVSPNALANAIQHLEESALMSRHGSGTSAELRLEGDVHPLIPKERGQRVRVGLLDMVDKMGLFLERVMEMPEQPGIGQKAFVFKARPTDLIEFLREHSAFALERIKDLEERAEREGGGVRSVMVWAASQFPAAKAKK